eukprot:TRINITY_DN188_c0_g1_i1.p1 TRINITY_DN188_c0_g1~~TRINITY_DN188_c0_g1_i1.p1  ORF type:complete len:327 (-),score=123.63 TRINITY_DN188_c0_g1_i1:229-1209(-)
MFNAKVLLLVLAIVAVVLCQQRARPPIGPPGGPPGGPPNQGSGNEGTTCSSNVANYATPSASSNCESWSNGNTYIYPSGFNYGNEVQWYECPSSQKRIVVSNGIPNHDVIVGNPNSPCEIPWYVSLPINGTYGDVLSEPGALGIIAMQLNGVPIYGAQEAEGLNAVEPDSSSGVQDAQYWFGHSAPFGDWHYHNPYCGNLKVDENTFIGYALDGFPIYGPMQDNSELDECNGMFKNGNYEYHVQYLDQVDGTADYCNGDSPAIQWNYVLGCFHGDISKTTVGSSDEQSIPSDCQKVTLNDVFMMQRHNTNIRSNIATKRHQYSNKH